MTGKNGKTPKAAAATIVSGNQTNEGEFMTPSKKNGKKIDMTLGVPETPDVVNEVRDQIAERMQLAGIKTEVARRRQASDAVKVEYVDYTVGMFEAAGINGAEQEGWYSFRRTDLEKLGTEHQMRIDNATIWPRFNMIGAYEMMRDGVVDVPVIDGQPEPTVHVVHKFDSGESNNDSPIIIVAGTPLLGYINWDFWGPDREFRTLAIHHAEHGYFCTSLRRPLNSGWFGLYRIARGMMEVRHIQIQVKTWWEPQLQQERRRHNGLLNVVRTHDFINDLIAGTPLKGFYLGITCLENKLEAAIARNGMTRPQALAHRNAVLTKQNEYFQMTGTTELAVQAGEIKREELPTREEREELKKEENVDKVPTVVIMVNGTTTVHATLKITEVVGRYQYRNFAGKLVPGTFNGLDSKASSDILTRHANKGMPLFTVD